MSKGVTRATPVEREPFPGGPLKTLEEHAGLVLGVLAVAFVAIRVIAVSGFNSTSATAVLATQGTSNVVVGVLVGDWPILGLGLLCAAVIYRLGGPRDKAPWPYVISTALVLVFLVPSPIAVLLFLLLVVDVLDVRVRRRRKSSQTSKARRPERGQRIAVLGLVLAIAAILVSAVYARPWLPSETFTLKAPPEKGDQTFVGYALGVEKGDLLVLRSKDRTVERYPLNTFDSREFCTTDLEFPGSSLVPSALRNGVSLAGQVSIAAGPKTPNYPPCD